MRLRRLQRLVPGREWGLQSTAVGVRSLCWLAGQNHIGMFGELHVERSGIGVLHRVKLGVFWVLAFSLFRDRYCDSIRLFVVGANCYRGRLHHFYQ